MSIKVNVYWRDESIAANHVCTATSKHFKIHTFQYTLCDQLSGLWFGFLQLFMSVMVDVHWRDDTTATNHVDTVTCKHFTVDTLQLWLCGYGYVNIEKKVWIEIN